MKIEMNLTNNTARRAGALLTRAVELGMDVSGYGELGENARSGNVYLWLEDYNFCLYIAPCSRVVMACYSCPQDGEETMRVAGRNLYKLEQWAEKLARKSEEKGI